MIVVFDMDDTLYDEITYVESGFRTVCDFLHQTFKAPKQKCFELMMKELKKNGRGKIFNVALEKYGILNKTNIRKCVSIYRTHTPDIELNKEAIDCFKRFHDYPKYVVTDGNKIAQGRKVDALGLKQMMKKVFITHQYGLSSSKPSPYCFFKIMEMENSNPQNIVYIGDNPNKDFVGIKPLGFKTIRIRKGDYMNEKVSLKYDAQISIDSLDELTPSLLNDLINS